MKTEFKQYLEALGMTRTLIGRVGQIEQFYRRVCPDELKAVFVSEYVKEDGGREYESVWFFSDRFAMEAKAFVTSDDFDIMPCKQRVLYLRIQKTAYDFEKATDQSRMNVHYADVNRFSGDMKASKENCDHLRDIYLSLIVPNLAG